MDYDDERALGWQLSPPPPPTATLDIEDEHAQQWQSSPTETSQELIQSPSTCDDHWFVPSYCPVEIIEGELDRIGLQTSAHLALDQERVNLWGPPECIADAKHKLNVTADYYFESLQEKSKSKRSKGWAKPERELTPVEKKKKERALKREMENQKYLGQPRETCPFYFCFLWPKNMSAFATLGGNLQALNGIRAEFKSYIWMEKHRDDVKIYVAGQDELMVENAMHRIENFCTYQTRTMSQPQGYIMHVMERPSKLVQIYKATVGDIKVKYSPHPFVKPGVGNPLMFLKARVIGHKENLAEIDTSLEIANSQKRSNDELKVLESIEKMTANNAVRIRQQLHKSLQVAQFLNRDYKMRIRLGLVGLRTYPLDSKWGVLEADAKIVQDNRLKSEFSPFITSSATVFQQIVDKLQSLDPRQTMQSETTWSLYIWKKIEAQDRSFDAIELEVTFREDGKVALWNALVDKSTPMDIRIISTERNLSWAWTLTAGRRLASDQTSPEGAFVHKLVLERKTGQEDRLSYSNTKDVQLKHIRREDKLLFICDGWICELKSEAFWTLEKLYKPFQSALLNEVPDKQLFSVSMYKDSWPSRFSDNPHLGFGQAASWRPEDFTSADEELFRTFIAVSKLRTVMEEAL
ncbi:hypothetical protein BGZ83_000487 [Gryganskiella cystojenkinii]|nr:hypothetical protein BGZ83_000487 [Gryganskiella cystojenkinii]